MLPGMTTILKAIAAFPRPLFDGHKYPVRYAQALLGTQPEWVPQEYQERARRELDSPQNVRGKPRRKSPSLAILQWHAFLYWCEAEGQDLDEATLLLAAEYMTRAGIEAPADIRLP
jgi:hypothetical protein